MGSEECPEQAFPTLAGGGRRIADRLSVGCSDPAAIISTDSFQRCYPVFFVDLGRRFFYPTSAALPGTHAIVLVADYVGSFFLVVVSASLDLLRSCSAQRSAGPVCW